MKIWIAYNPDLLRDGMRVRVRGPNYITSNAYTVYDSGTVYFSLRGRSQPFVRENGQERGESQARVFSMLVEEKE